MEDSMRTKPKRIKIKLGLSEKSTNYYKSVINWEGEGGATAKNSALSQINVPFEKGDRLEVLSGVIDFDDDEIVYVADVQKISEG